MDELKKDDSLNKKSTEEKKRQSTEVKTIETEASQHISEGHSSKEDSRSAKEEVTGKHKSDKSSAGASTSGKTQKITDKHSHEVYPSRLKHLFFEQIIPEMVKQYTFTNVHQVPRITKIVLSMGLGKRDVKKNVDDLTLIAGQKAVITKAKKSISQFSVRAGFDSGAKVTLRGNNMYQFLDRLLNIALLNWRAFSGISKKSMSKQKFITLSLGIADKRLFSEVQTDAIRSEGLNITICTNSKSIEQCKTLLTLFGFPFGGA